MEFTTADSDTPSAGTPGSKKLTDNDNPSKVEESFENLKRVLSEDDQVATNNTVISAKEDEEILTEISASELSSLQALRSRLSSEINSVLEDDDCLRFLKARSMSVTKALKMIGNWYKWYYFEKWRVCDSDVYLTPNEFLKCGFAETDEYMFPKQLHVNRLLPHFHCGEDKEGNPIYWEKTGQVGRNMPEIKKLFTIDDLVFLHTRGMELITSRKQFQSQKYGRKINKHIVIFDFNNLSYAVEPLAFRSFHRFTTIDQEYYPESLKAMIIINAPWFFPYIWAIVRPWLDPVTASKVEVLGTDFLPKLREYVDDGYIPVEYGGTCEGFTWSAPYPVTGGGHPEQIKEYQSWKESTRPAPQRELVGEPTV